MINKANIESWLLESRKDTASNLGLKADWWPTTNKSGQSSGTSWATSFFLQATSEFYGPEEPTIYCSKGTERKCVALINFFNLPHIESQLMVDFAAAHLDEQMPFRLTAESEMSPTQSVEHFSIGGGYLWDYFKLLVIPSPVRLFMARIASTPGQTATSRITVLAERMAEMYIRYREGLIPADVQLGAVIIPAAKASRSETRILWTADGNLQCEAISDFPL